MLAFPIRTPSTGDQFEVPVILPKIIPLIVRLLEKLAAPLTSNLKALPGLAVFIPTLVPLSKIMLFVIVVPPAPYLGK